MTSNAACLNHLNWAAHRDFCFVLISWKHMTLCCNLHARQIWPNCNAPFSFFSSSHFVYTALSTRHNSKCVKDTITHNFHIFDISSQQRFWNQVFWRINMFNSGEKSKNMQRNIAEIIYKIHLFNMVWRFREKAANFQSRTIYNSFIKKFVRLPPLHRKCILEHTFYRSKNFLVHKPVQQLNKNDATGRQSTHSIHKASKKSSYHK